MGQQLYLTVSESTEAWRARLGAGGGGASVQVVQEWDGMTNLPDSMSGVARGLTKGVTYTVHLVSTEAASR